MISNKFIVILLPMILIFVTSMSAHARTPAVRAVSSVITDSSVIAEVEIIARQANNTKCSKFELSGYTVKIIKVLKIFDFLENDIELCSDADLSVGKRYVLGFFCADIAPYAGIRTVSEDAVFETRSDGKHERIMPQELIYLLPDDTDFSLESMSVEDLINTRKVGPGEFMKCN